MKAESREFLVALVRLAPLTIVTTMTVMARIKPTRISAYSDSTLYIQYSIHRHATFASSTSFQYPLNDTSRKDFGYVQRV